MKEINITTTVTEIPMDELSPAQRRLVEAARKATYRSYAPYSHFHVGASILLDSDEVVTGSNQENAAYPSGICAERTACYWAHSAHPDQRMQTIAIAARGIDGGFLKDPISPCGACRQALLEYEKLSGQPIEVLLAAADRVYRIESIRALLPLAFDDLA